MSKVVTVSPKRSLAPFDLWEVGKHAFFLVCAGLLATGLSLAESSLLPSLSQGTSVIDIIQFGVISTLVKLGRQWSQVTKEVK